MDPASRLNATIDALLPAAGAALSRLGRRAWFPADIPAQSAEARGCAINATIGEVTDGHGHPLALPLITEHFAGVDLAEVMLYAPQGGQGPLRQRWQDRLKGRLDVPMSLPLVTSGITHALFLAADLFVDDETDVLLPNPCWGNYKQVFGVRKGGRLHGYPACDERGLDLDGIAAALRGVNGRGVILLNFPGNPTGYTPTLAEGEALVALLRAQPGPLVVLFDDAYQGMSWEQGLIPRSLFYDIAGQDADRLIAVKLDGVTKELFYFGARVGFLTFGANGPGGEALSEKARGLMRSSVSSGVATSQTLVSLALASPQLEVQRRAVLDQIEQRYRVLKDSVAAEGLRTWPFNSGFFALVPVGGDAEVARRRLLREAGVGVVSFAEAHALRISYGSTRVEDIPTLVRAVKERV